MNPIDWIIDDILAASAWPDRILEKILEQKIKVIINLTPNHYREVFPQEITYYQIPITNDSYPTEKQIQQFLSITKKHEINHDKILVHCMSGCGRTGIMVSIWAYKTNRIPGEMDLITWIRSKRNCFIEDQAQEDFIRNWIKKSKI